MNVSREALRTRIDTRLASAKALAALGGVTVAAMLGGGSLLPSVAAAHTKAPGTEAAHKKKSLPLEALGPLGQQTVVQMVEQKPLAFYNGEIVVHERYRFPHKEEVCMSSPPADAPRCVKTNVANSTVSYYNPLLIARTKSANINNPASGDFAIGTIAEEPGNSDVNGGGPPNYCAAYVDKPNVKLFPSNVGVIDASNKVAGWAGPKIMGVTLEPTNVLQPSVEYVTFPLDSTGGLEYGRPTNPLTGQVYLDPSINDTCVLSVADDAFTN